MVNKITIKIIEIKGSFNKKFLFQILDGKEIVERFAQMSDDATISLDHKAFVNMLQPGTEIILDPAIKEVRDATYLMKPE